jgi:integrase
VLAQSNYAMHRTTKGNGMANIRKRQTKEGEIYYSVQIRLKGHEPQNQSFKRLTDAKKWAQLTEAALLEGRHFKTSESKKHTLGEAIDRYTKSELAKFQEREQVRRKPILAWWKTKIGHCLLSDISTATISNCLDYLSEHGADQGRPLAPATVKRYLLAISHVIKACQKFKWLHHDPLKNGIIELPKERSGIVRFLDDEELARLTAACKQSDNPQLYPAFMLAVSTGMRRAETMYLYWREPTIPPTGTAWGVVNLTEKCIILHQTKNGNRRRVPLAGEALTELQKLNKVRRLDTQFVFPSPTHPQQPIELKKAWRTALRQSEVVNFRWHDLRHTAASYLAQSGAPLLDIAAILGHSTLQMVQRYAHLSDNHITATVEKMNQRIGGA